MSKDEEQRPHEILVALAGVGGAGHQPTYGGGHAGQCGHQTTLPGTYRPVQVISLFLLREMQVSVGHRPTSHGGHACQ